jgi:hypothetical protein
MARSQARAPSPDSPGDLSTPTIGSGPNRFRSQPVTLFAMRRGCRPSASWPGAENLQLARVLGRPHQTGCRLRSWSFASARPICRAIMRDATTTAGSGLATCQTGTGTISPPTSAARNAVRWASSTAGWIGPRLSISTRAFADARTHCRPHLALSRCTSSSMSVCRQIGSRHIAMLAFCLACAACSGMHDMPEEPNPAPDVKKAIPSVKAVAAQYHLTGQLEIAGPIEAPIMSSVRWVICLRAASAPQQTHTLFFKADTNVSSRISTLGDHCDAQSYRPLPN